MLKKDKVGNNSYVFLVRLVLVVFAILVIFMPLLYLSVNYFLIAALILAIVLFALRKSSALRVIYQFILAHPVITLFLFALVVRLIAIIILSPRINQVSDFGFAYLDSLDAVPSRHVPLWPHFVMYPYFLHFLVSIFGTSPLVGGVTHAIIGALSVVLVYLICIQIANKKVGIIAALLFGLWPSNIIYTSIYAPDHANVMLILLAVYAFIRASKSEKHKQKILFGIGCLVSLLFLSFFKDMSIVLILAFAALIAFSAIRTRSLKPHFRNLALVGALFALSFIGSLATRGITEAAAGQPLNTSPMPYWLMTGLGGNSQGTWDETIYTHYETLMADSGYDFDAVNGQMMNEAIDRIIARAPYLPLTIFNKSRELTANDEAKLLWVQVSADEAGNSFISESLRTIVSPLNGVFFAALIIMICMAIPALWSASESSRGLLLPIILLLGVFSGFLILEVQNRYRYSIEPVYCIVAAYGFCTFQKRVNRRISDRLPQGN